MNFIFIILFCLNLNLIKSQTIFAKQTTKLLDNLLLNYNKYSRPSNEITKVHVNLEIKDLYYNRKDMMFTLNCILNQWWLDSRLSYWNFFIHEKNKTYLGFEPIELTHKLSSIKLPNQYKIWLPNTIIINGSPINKNLDQTRKLIRLYLDGKVLYSTKIIFNFKCLMDLTKFPHDYNQRCSLYLGSFSYTDKEISYKWMDKNPYKLSSNLKLSQFELTKIVCLNKTRKLSQLWVNSKKYRSTLNLDFYFKRNNFVYLIEVYLPCIFLVILSWVSFYINREATNARIMIGSMTTLSMIILLFENRLLVKSVPYLSAIDYFVIVSFIFIFSSILEFIFVHHFTKLASGDIGTFSNLIPIHRIAKLIYNSLQPKDQIKSNKIKPNLLNKNDQLVEVLGLNVNEPMIYDLPITDNKDEQTILMNNLILSNQALSQQILNNNNQFSNNTTLPLPPAELLRSPTNLDTNNNLPNNYSTFPRVNHHTISYQDSFNKTDQLNDTTSLINSLKNNLNYSSKTLTLKKRSTKLASIPEEIINQEQTKLQLSDNLKLLRQEQEQQLEEQQNYQLLKNTISEFDEINETNENELKSKLSIKNKLGHRINEKLKSNYLVNLILKFLSKHNLNNQLDTKLSINQLNSISKIDQVCRVLFPFLYILFILSYYIIFVI